MTGWQAIVSALALGLTAGVLSGMFGIGGGLVIVPALVLFFQLDIKTATGTSLFAILWPVGLLGVLEYWRRGEMQPIVGLWIAVGLLLGAFFGAKLTGIIPAVTQRRIYAGFLFVVATYLLATSRPKPGPMPVPEPPGPTKSDQVH